MKKMLSVIAVLALAVQGAMANPLPSWQATEFSTQPSWIELWFHLEMDLSGMILRTGGGAAVIDSGVYVDPYINSYIVLDQSNTSGFTLDPVCDSFFIDTLYIAVHYGPSIPWAVAPLPGESSISAINDGWWFIFNRNPNPGGPDEVPNFMWGDCGPIINEISVHGTWNGSCGFIELYNLRDYAIDLSGYQLICNARYTLPEGVIMQPGSVLAIDQERYPQDFGPVVSGDIIYLCDDQGNLIDQVGWSSDHGEDVSFMRFPDGNVDTLSWRDFAGFDDTSSYTFQDGFPSRRAPNRYENPGLKVIGISADTSGSRANIYWTDPIWLTIFDASILRKSTAGYPLTPFDGDLVYEGRDQQYLGDTIEPGVRTYYTVFARTGCGQYSEPDSESQISVLIPYVGVDEKELLPRNAGFIACYPNPFNAAVLVRYQVMNQGPVTLSIYNIAGQKIEVLVNSEQPAGEHAALWNAQEYTSGVYFARLEAGGLRQCVKLVLLR